MASAKPNPLQGFGRGIFGLKNWDPLRKPKGRGLDGSAGDSRPAQFNSGPPARPDNARPGAPPNNGNDAKISQAKGSRDIPKAGAPLKAGYSYTANPNSPLGHELSFTQNDSLKFIEAHRSNSEWWVAETANGTLGFVPAKYMVSCELTSLPWLQGREEEVEPTQPSGSGSNVFGAPEKGTIKKYRASYDHSEIQVAKQSTSQWNCDICEKDFNGPKPYQAHMASKAHKEEVAYRQGGN